MKKFTKRTVAAALAFILTVTPVLDGHFFSNKEVQAEQLGSLSDKVTGTLSLSSPQLLKFSSKNTTSFVSFSYHR